MKTFFLYISIFISGFLLAQTDTLQTVDLETTAFQKPVGYQVKILQIDSVKLNNRLSDVLTRESSVFIKQYGPGNLASVSVRGTSSSQNQVFWNGIPMSSVTLGQVNLNLIRPLTSNTIEMIYGGGEAGSYPGAIGSSIYLNNVLEFKKQNTFSYSGFYGAFETYRQNGVVSLSDSSMAVMFSWNSARSLNNFEYYNTYNEVYQEREEAKQVNLDYSLHTAYKLNKYNQLKLNILIGDSKKDIPRPVSINVPLEKQIQNDETRLVTLGWNHHKYSNKMSLQWGHQKLRNYFDDLSTSSSASIIDINQHFIQARFSTHLGRKSRISASWDSELSDVESSGFSSKKVRQLHFMNLGYKYDINPEFLLSVNAKPTKLDSRKIDVLSNIALEYSPDKFFKIYGHLSNNVRYPTLNDLYWSNGGNENLNPEKSIQLELGAEKVIHQIKLSVNAYNNLVKDWILWQPQSSGLWTPKNVLEVRSYGVEVGLGRVFKLSSQSVLDVKLTSTLGKVVDTKSRHELIYMPKRKMLYHIGFKHRTFTAYLSGEFTSDFYITTDNTGYMPSYDYHNFRVSKSFKINKLKVRLNLGVNNITNSDFQIVANYPMPRRHINFGFTLSQSN